MKKVDAPGHYLGGAISLCPFFIKPQFDCFIKVDSMNFCMIGG